MKLMRKQRILSFFLALLLLVTALPINNVVANADDDMELGSALGSVAEFSADKFDLYLNPQKKTIGTSVIKFVDYKELPSRIVIENYYQDANSGEVFYKVRGANGEIWDERFSGFNWIKAKYINIISSGEVYIKSSAAITDNTVFMSVYEKIDLIADSTLQGNTEYKWQILVDGLWIDIYEEHGLSIELDMGIMANALDDSNKAYIRCVSASGSKTVVSEPITVNITNKGKTVTRNLEAYNTYTSQNYGIMTADDNVNDTVDVTVRFLYGKDNTVVSADRTYTVQKGGVLKDTFTLPVMAGYDAYLGDDRNTVYTSYSLNYAEGGLIEDTVITFYYWAAKVNYTVIYYLQNAEDDNYTEQERVTVQDFTGEIAKVDNRYYDGFYQLLYESVPIASDGSTVIEVYYDRLYYKLLFDLDGGYGVQPIYARYGTSITVPSPTKYGYAFVGWDYIPLDENGNKGDGDGIADTLPETIPYCNSAYRAIWLVNDSAKVTVVYWGENPNNEDYSYLESREIYAKPNTELNYGSEQLICSLQEHTHGSECEYSCGLQVHNHSIGNGCYTLICDKVSHNHTADLCTLSCDHTHTVDCYELSSYGVKFMVTTKPTEELLHTGDGIYTYTTSEYWWETEHYYLLLDGLWYCAYSVRGEEKQDTAKIALKCNHSHSDGCYSCGKVETEHIHTVSGGCYQLVCTQIEHFHNNGCYACVEHHHDDNCYLKTDYMNTSLWKYVRSDTVTVAADGSTVMNVYYDRTEFTLTFYYNYSNRNYQDDSFITDKWGANIGDRFLLINDTAGGNLWSTSNGGDSPWTSFLQIMPQNNQTYYCRNTSTNEQPAEYYTQNLDGSYKLHYTVTAFYSKNLTISEEDFYEIEGFTYDHGKDGDGDSMDSPGSYGDFAGAKFYYTRNNYLLSYYNGEQIIANADKIVSYEAPLDSYSSYTPPVPEMYEPGSVTFGGWYENPECTKEFDFNSTMPANNVVVYAKWEPVVHTVKFYTDKSYVGTETVYGEPYQIAHGGVIQDPYIPPSDPIKGNYLFVGWFYIDSNGNEQMWDFVYTTVTRNIDIYAKWSSNTLMPYEVKFIYKSGDNEIEIAKPIKGSALGGSSKTFDAKGNEELYAGYQVGYFPVIQSHTITIDLEDTSKNTFTFYYEKIDNVPYTVYYLDAETNEYVYEPKVVGDNKKAIVTETYQKVAGYLPDKYQQTLIIDPDSENKIIFYYTKDDVNGMYVVHYWTQNTDGTYSEHSIFEGRGEKGSTVNAKVKDIPNFTYCKGHEKEVLEGKISVEEVLELNVYYTRNKYLYKVQYLEEGTGKVLSKEYIQSAYWDDIITEKAIEIENYQLISAAEQSIQIRKDTDNPTVNIITFFYKKSLTSLTVKKQGTNPIDENQTFLFRVQGNDGVDITVAVHGDSQITICDLKSGCDYTVTEITEWSWRYRYDEVVTSLKKVDVENGATVTLNSNADSNTVTFVNKRQDSYWLDGNSYNVNIYKGE